MSLLDLLESISGAPRTGMGFGDGAGGGLPATGGSSPPMCQPPMPMTDGDDGGPDYSDPRMPAPPMTMDDVTAPPPEDASGSADTNQSGTEGQDEAIGDTMNRWKKERKVIDVLGKYGRWMNKGTTGERALKFLTGMVVVPIGAVLACGEDTVKTYIPTMPGGGSGR